MASQPQVQESSLPCPYFRSELIRFLQAGTTGNISFVLMVNKQGQTRLASYYDWMSVPQRVQLGQPNLYLASVS